MTTDLPASIDEYLASVTPEAARASLSNLRAVIRHTLPDAEELISYGIPTFKFNGTIVCFAAYKKHCSFFPGHTVAEFTEALKGYKTSKGTIQFPHDKPLPEQLVRAIVQARWDESLVDQAAKQLSRAASRK